MLRIEEHRDRVRTVAFSPDGALIASAGDGRRVRFWDRVTGEPLGHVSSLSRYTSAVAFAPDGRALAAAGRDRVVRLWDVAARTLLWEDATHASTVHSLDYATDGRAIVTTCSEMPGYAEGHAEAIVRDAEGRRRAILYSSLPLNAACFSPDGRTVAVASYPQVLLLWDLERSPRELAFSNRTNHDALRVLRSLPLESMAEVLPAPAARALAFAPDGRTVAGAFGPFLVLWDVARGANRATFRGQRLVIRSLAFAPDGATIATAGYDGTVRLIDAASGAERARFDWEIGKVDCVAFAPDGMSLAAGGERDIVVWDAGESSGG